MMEGKKIFGFLKDEIVYGGHVLSLGAVCIVFTFALLLGIEITVDFLMIAYLLPYIAYSYNRVKEVKDDFQTNSSRAGHLVKHMRLSTSLLYGAIVLLFLLAFHGNAQSLSIILAMAMAGILYTERFKMFTKKITGLKSFYVSIIWTLLVLLLAVYYGYPINIPLLIICTFFFLRCIVNTAFFDIKDIEADKVNGLKTLPIVLGADGIFTFIHVVNLLSYVVLIYGVVAGDLPRFSLSLLVFYFYTYYYLWLAKDGKSDIRSLSYVMVDGEYLLWPVVVLLSVALTNYK